jgi:hypothetical protein
MTPTLLLRSFDSLALKERSTTYCFLIPATGGSSRRQLDRLLVYCLILGRELDLLVEPQQPYILVIVGPYEELPLSVGIPLLSGV